MDADRLLIFKVCVSALWANEKMARQERDYVNNLIERLSETEKDKTFLKQIQAQDINLKSLEPEIRNLSNDDKQRIFEECFGVITSDKILDELDIRFLINLKNVCGISNRYYRGKIKEARIYKGVKIKRNVKRFAIILVVALLAYQATSIILSRQNFEKCLNEDISPDFVAIQISDSKKAKRQKLSAEEVYESACKSVVTVYLKRDNKKIAQGTGSIIGKGGDGYYILTNKHVVTAKDTKIRYPLSYEIQLYTGARFDAQLDFYSRKVDLALLRAKMPDEYVKIIKISPEEFQHTGARVYSLGTPIGMTNTFTEGIVSALRDKYIQTDATIFLVIVEGL